MQRGAKAGGWGVPPEKRHVPCAATLAERMASTQHAIAVLGLGGHMPLLPLALLRQHGIRAPAQGLRTLERRYTVRSAILTSRPSCVKVGCAALKTLRSWFARSNGELRAEKCASPRNGEGGAHDRRRDRFGSSAGTCRACL